MKSLRSNQLQNLAENFHCLSKVPLFQNQPARKFFGKLSIGFSMIEILLALVFLSFAFLPIYNLFRFGERGAWSNEKEIEATNYAADLINFMREQKLSDLSAIFPNKSEYKLKKEEEIRLKLKSLNPPLTPDGAKGFTRSMTIQKFNGFRTGIAGVTEKIISFFQESKSVPNYLVQVTVNYHKKGQSMGNDEIRLSTIVTP